MGYVRGQSEHTFVVGDMDPVMGIRDDVAIVATIMVAPSALADASQLCVVQRMSLADGDSFHGDSGRGLLVFSLPS